MSLCFVCETQDGPTNDSFNHFPILNASPSKEPEVVVDIESMEADVEQNGPPNLEQQKETSETLPTPASKKRVRSRGKSKFRWHNRNSLGSLPTPLALPKKYPTDVATALSHQKLSKAELTRLISQVAKVIFPMKAYPSREELTQVAMQLTTEYPFIQSTVGVSSVRISCACHARLSQRMHLYFDPRIYAWVVTHSRVSGV